MKQKELCQEIEAAAKQSYNQLDGDWHQWLDVAKRYEHKVPYQDRLDIRHTIILELAKARRRDGQPIPLLRAYRIASLTVALYWRQTLKSEVKICIYDGVAKEPHCDQCKHKPKDKRCAYLALRPIQSLDSEVTNEEGDTVKLMDTVADDQAIDLAAWQEAKTFLLGCPMRLVQLANKRRKGLPLNDRDRRYFNRQSAKELARYQKTLF